MDLREYLTLFIVTAWRCPVCKTEFLISNGRNAYIRGCHHYDARLIKRVLNVTRHSSG